VLRRLGRIEALDRERAPSGQLLGELRELVHEAEAWARSGLSESDASPSGEPGLDARGVDRAAAPKPRQKSWREAEGMS